MTQKGLCSSPQATFVAQNTIKAKPPQYPDERQCHKSNRGIYALLRFLRSHKSFINFCLISYCLLMKAQGYATHSVNMVVHSRCNPNKKAEFGSSTSSNWGEFAHYRTYDYHMQFAC